MKKLKEIFKIVTYGVASFTPTFSMEKEENEVLKFSPEDLLVKRQDYSSFKYGLQYKFHVDVSKKDQKDLCSDIKFVFAKDENPKYKFHDVDIEMTKTSIKKAEDLLIYLSKEPIHSNTKKDIKKLKKEIELRRNEMEELKKISKKIQLFKNTKQKSIESLAYQFFNIQTSNEVPYIPSFEMNDFNTEFLVNITFANIYFVNLEALQWLDAPNLKSIDIELPCKEILFFLTVIKSIIKASLPFTNINCNNVLLNDPNISRSEVGSVTNTHTQQIENYISPYWEKLNISRDLMNDYIIYKSYYYDGTHNNRCSRHLYKKCPIVYDNPREYKKLLKK